MLARGLPGLGRVGRFLCQLPLRGRAGMLTTRCPCGRRSVMFARLSPCGGCLCWDPPPPTRVPLWPTGLTVPKAEPLVS